MKRKTLLAIVLVASVFAMPIAGAQESVNPAKLEIQQPHYIDEPVERTSVNGTPVYTVNGRVHTIKPQNFNTTRLVDFGVREQVGSLSYDDRMGTFRFNTDGASGSFTLYWVVNRNRLIERPVNDSSNETESEIQSVQVRYEAIIKSESQNLTHVSEESIAGTRGAAKKWQEFNSSLHEPGVGGDRPTEQLTQLALDFVKLRYHPLAALTGDFLGLLLALVLGLSGNFILLIFFMYHYLTRRGDIKELHKRESLESGDETIIDRLEALREQERIRSIENSDWYDIFPNDQIAHGFRKALGENPFTGFLRYLEVAGNILQDRLMAMGKAGYYGLIERADDGTIADMEIVHEDDLSDVWDLPDEGPSADGGFIPPDDQRELVGLENPTVEMVGAVDFTDPAISKFHLDEVELAPDEQQELQGYNLETIIERLEVQIPRDFDSQQEFARYLMEFLAFVNNHEYTTEDGAIRPMRHAINLLLRLTRVMGDKHNIPLGRFHAEHLEMLLVNTDLQREVEEFVNEVQEGKHNE